MRRVQPRSERWWGKGGVEACWRRLVFQVQRQQAEGEACADVHVNRDFLVAKDVRVPFVDSDGEEFVDMCSGIGAQPLHIYEAGVAAKGACVGKRKVQHGGV